MEVNRSLLDFVLRCAGNTWVEAVCFPRINLADLARSLASFNTSSLITAPLLVALSNPDGVSLAFAERERGLSCVLGRRVDSAILRFLLS